jgi:UDP-glucose 4-epimerase
MTRILVSGGAGFIGSHFAESFISKGHDVLILDDLSTGSEANLPKSARLELGKIESEQTIILIKTFRPETIFHFAAQIDVRVSAAQPVHDAQQNIINSLRLLECGLQNGLRYFAFASSGGAIYGEPQAGPQDEDHPERPLSPYGVAKLCVDKYLASFSHQLGLQSCSMRFSNVYGPRQNGRGEAGVVALFITRALAGLPIRINGEGTQTRDFIYVQDLARAGELILTHRPQGILNLGTGIETSICRLADFLKAQFPGGLEISHNPAILGEQLRSVLDPSRAKRILQWEPTTTLNEGLMATTHWFADVKNSNASLSLPTQVS